MRPPANDAATRQARENRDDVRRKREYPRARRSPLPDGGDGCCYAILLTDMSGTGYMVQTWRVASDGHTAPDLDSGGAT